MHLWKNTQLFFQWAFHVKVCGVVTMIVQYDLAPKKAKPVVIYQRFTRGAKD